MWKIMASFVLGALVGGAGVYLGLRGAASMPAGKALKSVGDSQAPQKAKPSRREASLPGLAEAQALAARSMRDFAASLKEGRMDRFYASVSDYWKQRTTPAKLDEAFAPMLRAGIDLSGVARLRPLIEERRITPRGDLLLKGRYDVSNGSVLFSHSYRREPGRGWRLSSFFVRIVPAKAQKSATPKGK